MSAPRALVEETAEETAAVDLLATEGFEEADGEAEAPEGEEA